MPYVEPQGEVQGLRGNWIWATGLFWSLSLILQSSQSNKESKGSLPSALFPPVDVEARSCFARLDDVLFIERMLGGVCVSLQDQSSGITVKCTRSECGERLRGTSKKNTHGTPMGMWQNCCKEPSGR